MALVPNLGVSYPNWVRGLFIWVTGCFMYCCFNHNILLSIKSFTVHVETLKLRDWGRGQLVKKGLKTLTNGYENIIRFWQILAISLLIISANNISKKQQSG